MDTVIIHHIRPGKKEQVFHEGFVSEDEHGLSTLTILSDGDSKFMTKRLCSRGFIEMNDVVHSVAKYYSYSEHFNLLVFGDDKGNALGYYSDIAMPFRKVDDGYELVDLFLDIWLKPDGTLLELDWDEFQDASSKALITEEQQKLAVAALERLKEEVELDIYPLKYIRTGKQHEIR